MGGAGIVIEYGSSGNIISGTVFTDISAGAIIVGDLSDAYPQDLRQVTTNNRIHNNVVYDVAKEYWGSVGITGFYVDSLVIENNEVFGIPYSGISVGWGWGGHLDSETSRNNIIRANHVSHMMSSMSDGGGIYTLGQQPNSIIDGNLIHDL
ncbi:hypothetical protein D3C73_1070820 [compost metagenome]